MVFTTLRFFMKNLNKDWLVTVLGWQIGLSNIFIRVLAWTFNFWTANDHSLKLKGIIWQDLRYLSFYFSVCPCVCMCLSVRTIYATVLITQTCRSLFRFHVCTAWCHIHNFLKKNISNFLKVLLVWLFIWKMNSLAEGARIPIFVLFFLLAFWGVPVFCLFFCLRTTNDDSHKIKYTIWQDLRSLSVYFAVCLSVCLCVRKLYASLAFCSFFFKCL